MKIKQIRSATNKIFYGGKTFLLDPWLEQQYGLGCFDSIPGKPYMAVDPVKEKIPMPLFALPETVESILSGVDAYIITHIHPDQISICRRALLVMFWSTISQFLCKMKMMRRP